MHLQVVVVLEEAHSKLLVLQVVRVEDLTQVQQVLEHQGKDFLEELTILDQILGLEVVVVLVELVELLLQVLDKVV
jgi:hypothetical protein